MFTINATVVACILIAFLSGALSAYFIFRPKKDGSIVIEKSEDGERDRIRFLLSMDLDEIKKYKSITFFVDNHTT